MKKDILMKGCGGLRDVFVCMRAAEGGLRIYTNTEQRRRPNQN
jgi:hypothetical protein